jgi:phosphoesterase RecJ-like protein
MNFPSAPAETVAALAELLRSPRRVAIVTHYNPDGDALGSSLGLMHVLKAMGHQAQVVLPNPAPKNLHWMPGHAGAIDHDAAKEAAEKAIADADLVFCLDFNRADRVHGLEAAVRAASVKVLIDHHQDPDMELAAVRFSDTSASSTCQMVYDVIAMLGAVERIDADAATCIYTGILTDTGSFRFPSTSAHTLRVAADLLERGAVPHMIHAAIMEDSAEGRLRLLGFSLFERMRVHPELGTTVIALSKADLERFNYAPGDTEGLVNYGLSIRGIRLSAFFVERADAVKISLRSKGQLPVNEFLSAHFQGGGHANASGGQTSETLDGAVERFMKELPAFLKKHPA